jgi:hypothetical protein
VTVTVWQPRNCFIGLILPENGAAPAARDD